MRKSFLAGGQWVGGCGVDERTTERKCETKTIGQMCSVYLTRTQAAKGTYHVHFDVCVSVLNVCVGCPYVLGNNVLAVESCLLFFGLCTASSGVAVAAVPHRPPPPRCAPGPPNRTVPRTPGTSNVDCTGDAGAAVLWSEPEAGLNAKHRTARS